MSSFSWKCPFHVFVAGFLASVVISASSSIIYAYGYKKISSNKNKRFPDALLGAGYDDELMIATELALKAGMMIDANDRQSMNIMMKGSTGIDFVTQTDKDNEDMIFQMLKKKFPGYKFIGEESSSTSSYDDISSLSDDPTWIVDPIDGTTNFVHGFPYSCVSIALVVNKAPVLAVVYDPYRDELYHAIMKHGSYRNSKRMRVSQVAEIKNALVMTEFGYGRESGDVSRVCQCLAAVLKRKAHSIRLCGSAVLDLCYLAAGRVDVLYSGLGGDSWKPWDYAAGVLIVSEAGGCLSQINGDAFHLCSASIIAASCTQLQQELIDIVGQFYFRS